METGVKLTRLFMESWISFYQCIFIYYVCLSLATDTQMCGMVGKGIMEV